MDTLLYWMAKTIVACLQVLPLRFVARFGRFGGTLAWAIDTRHRKVALDNLRAAFRSERKSNEIDAIAREQFKRLGENYCCAVKTASMSARALQNHLEIIGAEHIRARGDSSAVFAIGHFGNFELYARASLALPDFQFATTYRALKQPGLNRVLLELRQRSGCWLFERRMDGDALRAAMTKQKLILGFLSDQHAGRHGAWLPFFGRECSTTTAPAVFALRYKLPLFTAICHRTSIGQWRIEVGDEIPTIVNEQRRAPKEIMHDVNRAFEAAIRRDPANWFWVHKRWKPVPGQPASDVSVPQPAPAIQED